MRLELDSSLLVSWKWRKCVNKLKNWAWESHIYQNRLLAIQFVLEELKKQLENMRNRFLIAHIKLTHHAAFYVVNDSEKTSKSFVEKLVSMKNTKFLLAFFPFNEFEKKILLFHIVIWQSWQKAIANRYDVITQAFLTFQREKVCGKTIVYDSHYFVVQKASGGNVMSHCEYFDKISILNHQQTTIERMWHHIRRFL